jgi:pimeloyl-ACP methyl ester carboxylesterase
MEHPKAVLCGTLVALLIAVLSVADAQSPGQTTVGVLDGAAHRIVAPARWDGTVVIFLHGYADKPGTFTSSAPVGELALDLVARGAIYADAGYRAGGWAVAQAIEDVARLRAHIVTRFGAPKRVVLIGESMGGVIGLALLEREPSRYQGGVAFCSGTIGAYDYFKRGAFDPLVMFEALFPSVLPPADNVPASFRPSEEAVGSVLKALRGDPNRAAIVQRAASLPDIPSVAEMLVLHLDAVRELSVRAGGNPFDNSRTEYPGLVRDGKPIAAVRRVKSVPAAERYLRQFYTPTGRLRVPFLAVNVKSDPVVPIWATDGYPRANQYFVQQYVDGAGHCGVTKDQRMAAFGALQGWMDRGRRPAHLR